MSLLGWKEQTAEQILKDAADRLGYCGSVKTEFATGNKNLMGEPVADLVFSPTIGPHKDAIFVVEFKFTKDGDYLPSTELASSASAAEGFHADSPDTPVRLVVSTNGKLGYATERLARNYPVEFVDGVSTGEQLAERVAGIAGVSYALLERSAAGVERI